MRAQNICSWAIEFHLFISFSVNDLSNKTIRKTSQMWMGNDRIFGGQSRVASALKENTRTAQNFLEIQRDLERLEPETIRGRLESKLAKRGLVMEEPTLDSECLFSAVRKQVDYLKHNDLLRLSIGAFMMDDANAPETPDFEQRLYELLQQLAGKHRL